MVSTTPPSIRPGCAAYTQYGDLSGKSISVYASITSPEDQPHIDSYRSFECCTGATIVYEGSEEFEAQLPVKIKAASPRTSPTFPSPACSAGSCTT